MDKWLDCSTVNVCDIVILYTRCAGTITYTNLTYHFTTSRLCFLYVKENYGCHFYSKAINVLRQLTAAYDELFKRYDVIIMPTIKYKPPKLPPAGIPVSGRQWAYNNSDKRPKLRTFGTKCKLYGCWSWMSITATSTFAQNWFSSVNSFDDPNRIRFIKG